VAQLNQDFILSAKDNIFSLKYTLNLKGNLTHLQEPVVMGILNVTPDSFYDGGKYTFKSAILEQAEKMLSEGALIIDIGGYSSRPRADNIEVKEELRRVTDGIRFVLEEFQDALISVDTFRAEVAEAALNEGACMVNDISGGELDRNILDVVGRWNVPYVVMHMRGTPKNMAQKTNYDNILLEVVDYFQNKINLLRQLGVNEVIVDPGFGFAKNADQSFDLLRNLECFRVLETPVMIGVSRKSMIYRTLGINSEEALNGTTILNVIGLINGASILRVHDVKEAIECIRLCKKVYN
jgi:dihydropteroate synthase